MAAKSFGSRRGRLKLGQATYTLGIELQYGVLNRSLSILGMQCQGFGNQGPTLLCVQRLPCRELPCLARCMLGEFPNLLVLGQLQQAQTRSPLVLVTVGLETYKNVP